ncbi:MAG: hypothetical protein NTY53_11525 [Kiritimatiellaeota bacterium]|nr:hypothetical protein [Kiritimatiellota bacterium]
MLDNWAQTVGKFVKVMPIDYRKSLDRIRQREERQRLYYQSQGFLEGPPDDPQRFQLNYARIHGGCS